MRIVYLADDSHELSNLFSLKKKKKKKIQNWRLLQLWLALKG